MYYAAARDHQTGAASELYAVEWCPIKITQLDILKVPPSWVRAVSLYCKQLAAERME